MDILTSSELIWLISSGGGVTVVVTVLVVNSSRPIGYPEGALRLKGSTLELILKDGASASASAHHALQSRHMIHLTIL